MDEILKGKDHRNRISPAPPLLKRIVDFVASNLPLGAGSLKLGNFLYMFGGECRTYDGEGPIFYHSDTDDRFHHQGSGIVQHGLVVGFGLSEENPPRSVYKLDLADDQSEPVQLSPMFGTKLYAIVEEIGGQIYVLSRKSVSIAKPLFEVWNPMTVNWPALPNPPGFSDCGEIGSYCVCGGKIVCTMQDNSINRFSIASETWDCVEDSSSIETAAMDASFDVYTKDVYFGEFGRDSH